MADNSPGFSDVVFEELEEFFVQLRGLRKAFDPDRKGPTTESEIAHAFAFFQRLGLSPAAGFSSLRDPYVFEHAFKKLINAPLAFRSENAMSFWPVVGIIASWVLQLATDDIQIRLRTLDAISHLFDSADYEERIHIAGCFENLCSTDIQPYHALWESLNHFSSALEIETDLHSIFHARSILTKICSCIAKLAAKAQPFASDRDWIQIETLHLLLREFELVARVGSPPTEAIDRWIVALVALQLPTLDRDRSEPIRAIVSKIASLLDVLSRATGPLATHIKRNVQPRVMHLLHGRPKRDDRPAVRERFKNSKCLFISSGSGEQRECDVVLEDVCHTTARGLRLHTKGFEVATEVQISSIVQMIGATGSVAIDAAKLTIANTGLSLLDCEIKRAWRCPQNPKDSGWIVYVREDSTTDSDPKWQEWVQSVTSMFEASNARRRPALAKLRPKRSLEELLASEEDERLEFKASLRYDHKKQIPINKDLEFAVLRAVAAIGNTKGGTVLIGVDDATKEILGLARDLTTLHSKDVFQQHLRKLIEDQLGKLFSKDYLEISFPAVDGREVCRVDIKHHSESALVVKMPNNVEKVFVRIGNTTQALSYREFEQTIIANRSKRASRE